MFVSNHQNWQAHSHLKLQLGGGVGGVDPILLVSVGTCSHLYILPHNKNKSSKTDKIIIANMEKQRTRVL